MAACLRLWGLEHSPSGGDQAVLLNIALRWVTQGKLPLAANKSSVGLMNPPLLEYLLAVPLFLRRDMIWVARFVALINLASVAATFFVLRPALGQRVALLTTLLYAVNPWAVYYARLIWNPTLIPLFSTLLLASLLAAFAGRHTGRATVLAFLWLAAAIQLHLASLALVPALALLGWIFRRRLTIRALIAGAALFVLTFAPFIVYEIETGFMDLADFRQATSGTVQTNLAPVALAVELTQANGIWQTLGEAWSQWRQAAAWGEWLAGTVPWLLLAGLMVAGWRLCRHRTGFHSGHLTPQSIGLTVVVALFVAPLLFFVRHTAYLQTYYFLYLYPLPFVFMALAADAPLSWAETSPAARHRLWMPLAWLPTALLLTLAGWQFYVNYSGLQLVAKNVAGERQIWHVQRAIDTLTDWAAAHPQCDLVIASAGYNAESSELGQVSEFLAPRPVRYVALNQGIIVPRECGLYLVATDAATSRAWYEAHAVHLPEWTIPLFDEAWHFYELIPSPADDLAGAGIIGQWDNGVRLLDYRLSENVRPGEQLALTLTWQVFKAPPARRYHFFHHLVDGNGNIVAQADGPGVFSRYWQPDELFLTRFTVDIPPEVTPGRYRLLVGLYEWPSLERPALSGGGDSLPLAWIEIHAP